MLLHSSARAGHIVEAGESTPGSGRHCVRDWAGGSVGSAGAAVSADVAVGPARLPRPVRDRFESCDLVAAEPPGGEMPSLAGAPLSEASLDRAAASGMGRKPAMLVGK